VRTPRKANTLFRDSITCPNYGETEKVHPCSECFLNQYVHPSYRDVELPCHFIPLNAEGDTIDSLAKSGDIDKLEACLLSWLELTIKNLEAAENDEPEHPETSIK
jgi:hypothetical protein